MSRRYEFDVHQKFPGMTFEEIEAMRRRSFRPQNEWEKDWKKENVEEKQFTKTSPQLLKEFYGTEAKKKKLLQEMKFIMDQVETDFPRSLKLDVLKMYVPDLHQALHEYMQALEGEKS